MPSYVSSGVGGFQVAVSAGGATTTAYYAASGSACTTDAKSNPATFETCTYTLPNVGGTETIVVSETDTAPTTNGNGVGTGFPAQTNILGVGTSVATITLGTTTNVTVHVGEVVAEFSPSDEGCSNMDGAYFLESDASVSGNPRLVFPAGSAERGFDAVGAADASGSFVSSASAASTAFTDVDGTATAATAVSSSSAFTFYAVPDPSVHENNPPPYGQSASMPDSSYFFNANLAESVDDLFACFVFQFYYDGSPVANGSTFAVSNNLSAINPYTATSYAQTIRYSLSAVGVSPATATVAMGSTANVTGTDYDAPGNLSASKCTDSGGASHATIVSSAPLSTTTWTEPFVIVPTAVGTCTFTLIDNDVNVPTLPVTVTVTGS